MKTMLTIAGSDSSGGAGIQADIKTATALGVFATSAITAITAQNTTGVQAIFDLGGEIVAEEIRSVMTDISPDAVKIGMVSSPEIIKIIGEELAGYKGPVVLDPVMVATSGGSGEGGQSPLRRLWRIGLGKRRPRHRAGGGCILRRKHPHL